MLHLLLRRKQNSHLLNLSFQECHLFLRIKKNIDYRAKSKILMVFKSARYGRRSFMYILETVG